MDIDTTHYAPATGDAYTRSALALMWSATIQRTYGVVPTYVQDHFAGDYDAALNAWIASEVEDGALIPLDRPAYVRGWDAAEAFDIEHATTAPAIDTAPEGETDPTSWLAGYEAFRRGAL